MDFFDKSHPPLDEREGVESKEVTADYCSFGRLEHSQQKELFNSILLRFPIIQEEFDELLRLKKVQDVRVRSIRFHGYGTPPYKKLLNATSDAIEKYNILEKGIRDIIISGVESQEPSAVLVALSSMVKYYKEHLIHEVKMPYCRIIEGLKLIKISVKNVLERQVLANRYSEFPWIEMSVWATIWDGDWFEVKEWQSCNPDFQQLRSAALYTSTDQSAFSFKHLPTEIIQMILSLLVFPPSSDEVRHIGYNLRSNSEFLIGISSLCKSWSGEIRELLLSQAVIHSPAGLRLFAKQVINDKISHTIKTLTLNLDNGGKYFSVFRSFTARVHYIETLQIVGAGYDYQEKRPTFVVLDEIKLDLYYCRILKFNNFYFRTGDFTIPLSLRTIELRNCILEVPLGRSPTSQDKWLCDSLQLINCRIETVSSEVVIESRSLLPYLVKVTLDTLYPLRHLSASFPKIHTLVLLPAQVGTAGMAEAATFYPQSAGNSLTEVVIIDGLDQFLKLKTVTIKLGPIIQGKQWPENREDVQKFADKQEIKLEWIS